MFVAITVEQDVDVDHMDVSTAFLYADIQEKVFVEQAPGFVVKDKDCLLYTSPSPRDRG